jgi:hypothetical protein
MQTRELRFCYVCSLILYLIGHPVTGNSKPATNGHGRDVRITRTEQTWAERLRDSGLTTTSTGSSNRLGKSALSAISKPSDDERRTSAQDKYAFETDSQAKSTFNRPFLFCKQLSQSHSLAEITELLPARLFFDSAFSELKIIKLHGR